MKDATTRRLTGLEIALAGVVLILCAALWLVIEATDTSRPQVGLAALHGVTTIPEGRLDRGDVFALEGPWQVYWGQLLTPDDLARPDAPRPQGALRFPGSWRGESYGAEVAGGTGAATFRLSLRPPEGNRSLELRLFDLRLAYRLWANGALIAQSGRPALDAASEQADRSLVIAPLDTTGNAIDLVLQLSNHGFREGGVGDPILLASAGVLQGDRDRVWVLSALLCGILFAAGFYHLLIYALRPGEISFLYFGTFCLLILGYAANSNSTYWVSRAAIAGWITPAALDDLALVCYAASGAVIYRFYRSLLPFDISRRLQIVSDLRPIVFVLSGFVMPPVWRSWLVVVLMLVGLLFTAYFLVRLLVCVIKRQPGAILLFVGSILVASTTIHDVLVHADVIEGDYMLLHGLAALVVFQASALALHYAENFKTVERLSVDLGRNVGALKDEMSRRRDLESEVVQISEEERRRIGYQIHDGLCQQLTAARLRYSMLPNAAGAGDSTAMTELGRLLSAAIEDAYALSRGLWPVEHGPALAGPTIGELVDSARRTSGIEINLAQSWPCAACAGENLGVFHRIAQEALTNALRHADATRIDVSLSCEDGVTGLEVRDNGVGRQPNAGHADTGGLGLRIMRHRANAIGAEFAIEDAPDGGTIVRCRAHCHGDTCSGSGGNE